MSADAYEGGTPRLSGEMDPRHRDRQVADVVARLCAMRRNGETAAGALWAALEQSSAPISDDLLSVVAASCADGARWAETSVKVHDLARRWRSPILATLADAFSDGGYALSLDYLEAVALRTGLAHTAPSPFALVRQLHPRQGQRWEESEDRRLLDAFRQGTSIEAMSAEHERSPVAIRKRLLKCGVDEHELDGR